MLLIGGRDKCGRTLIAGPVGPVFSYGYSLGEFALTEPLPDGVELGICFDGDDGND